MINIRYFVLISCYYQSLIRIKPVEFFFFLTLAHNRNIIRKQRLCVRMCAKKKKCFVKLQQHKLNEKKKKISRRYKWNIVLNWNNGKFQLINTIDQTFFKYSSFIKIIIYHNVMGKNVYILNANLFLFMDDLFMNYTTYTDEWYQ